MQILFSGIIFPFGKNVGKPVETVFGDIHYMHWILAQPWIAEKHPDIYREIFNRVRTMMNDAPSFPAGNV